MAHEGVDAGAEHAGDPVDVGQGRGRHDPLAQPDAGQGDHDAKGQPPQDGGENLQVLGLGQVEKGEGSGDRDKGRQENPDEETLSLFKYGSFKKWASSTPLYLYMSIRVSPEPSQQGSVSDTFEDGLTLKDEDDEFSPPLGTAEQETSRMDLATAAP